MAKLPSGVGRSSRTPVKHDLLNMMTGKIVGALSTGNVPCHARPFLAVDLCGGDGSKSDTHDASPLILHKHCKWLSSRMFCRAELHVLELQSLTFDTLTTNTRHLDGFGEWFHVRHMDARTYVMPPLDPKQAAFVHCDPNTVDQIPLTQPFVASWNCFVTYLVTLGCNVSGLKRETPEKRAKWFEYVDLLVSDLPRHHDAILFWLNRDDAQWAYLLSIPQVWSEKFAARGVARGGTVWTKGLSSVSYRATREGFDREVKRLFLTSKEFSDADNT